MLPSNPPPRKMLITAEAAAYCGSSASTFNKLRLFGGGPVFVKLGRRVVYDPHKRTGVGLSRLGTSHAVALGAYAFALRALDAAAAGFPGGSG